MANETVIIDKQIINEEIVLKWLTDWQNNLPSNKLNDANFWQRDEVAKFIRDFGLKCNRWKYNRRGKPKKGYSVTQEQLKIHQKPPELPKNFADF